jgi:tRNA pseudouridine38-40 synthase
MSLSSSSREVEVVAASTVHQQDVKQKVAPSGKEDASASYPRRPRYNHHAGASRGGDGDVNGFQQQQQHHHLNNNIGVEQQRSSCKEASGSTCRYKVVVAYDGTDFAGWQVQSGEIDTIQQRIEKRLSNVFCGGASVGIQIAGSGRTDKGVHAEAQVFHFNAPLTIRLPEKKKSKINKNNNKNPDVVDATTTIAVDGGSSGKRGREEEEVDKAVKQQQQQQQKPDATTTSEEEEAVSKGRRGGGGGAAGGAVTMKETQVDADVVMQYLRGGLPPSIQVLSVEAVPESFHSRGSCIKKRYEYTIYEGGSASPFQTRYCHSLGHNKYLSISAMRRAAQHLIGRHDFSAFGVIDVDNNDTRDPVKNLERLDIVREGGDHDQDEDGDDEEESGGTIRRSSSPGFQRSSSPKRSPSSPIRRSPGFVRIIGCCDRFLWHMMRMLAGTLIEVGLGNITPEDVKMLLEGRGRGSKHANANVRVRTAPAQGLCLKEVYY